MPGMSPYIASQRIMGGAFATGEVAAKGSLEELQAKIERQNLLIQTLLMILLEKKVIHEDEFREWMVYVDELDGQRDGKLRPEQAPKVCGKCGRNSPKASVKCIYCGEEFADDFLVRRP